METVGQTNPVRRDGMVWALSAHYIMLISMENPLLKHARTLFMYIFLFDSSEIIRCNYLGNAHIPCCLKGPSVNYVHSYGEGGGGQASYTFILGSTCPPPKTKGGGGQIKCKIAYVINWKVPKQ